MMNKPPSFWATAPLACLLLALPLSSPAASISAGEPAIAGSGCPGGTTSYRTSANPAAGLILTIKTPAYRATPGNVTCNIAIPIQVRSGYRVTQITGVYGGYVKGKAEMRTSYFVAGSTGASIKTNLSSTNGKTFSRQDTPARLQAQCGADVNVRVNSRLRTLNDSSSAKVYNMGFYIRYSKC